MLKTKKRKFFMAQNFASDKKNREILGPAFSSSSSQKVLISTKKKLIYSVFPVLQTFKSLLGPNCTYIHGIKLQDEHENMLVQLKLMPYTLLPCGTYWF